MMYAEKLIVNISLGVMVKMADAQLGLNVNYIKNLRMKTIVPNAKTEYRKGVTTMPDKKLTDSEITKILEYCSNFGNCEYCSMIPPNGIKKGTLGCFSSLIKFALNVIEAKEKEKEKMRYHLADATVRFTALEKETKSEAYKEFAELAVERVDNAKQKYQRLCKEQGEEMEEHMHIHFNGITKIINDLLKEMVGK